jgi:hypothetical protein
MLRPFSLLRRSTAVGAVIALLMLIGAAAAQADFNATAGKPFSGVVDSPGCSTTPTAPPMIDWGDGTTATPGTYTPASGSGTDSVSGAHTYAAKGTFSVTITVPNCLDSGQATDFQTATVLPAVTFSQCPAVYLNTGCQFLITVANNGNSVQQDPNQGPYEGAEDALVGVVNNSTSSISHMPLSVAGSDLFGFDQDGICNPGSAPIPSGCVPVASTPACGPQGGSCSFPKPPGQPAGYVEPGNVPSGTQNGYEGPTTWFSNVSADASSGTVNFSPALQPGQSTYFSLEEPPTNTIGVGSTPTGGSTSPPKVGTSTASFSGTVNPEGLATTGFFQYGLDLRYSKLHASGANYDHQTPARAIGSDFNDHLFTSQVTGLVPNAIYHVRLVAQNADGSTFGPDVVFKTDKNGAPGPPIAGKTFNVSATGLVLIKLHGVFVPLTELRQIPNGTIVNALNGTLTLTTAGGTQHATLSTDAKHKKKKSKKAKTQTGKFGGAVFKVTQTRSGLTTLALVSNAFKGAPSFASCKAKKGTAAIAKLSKKTLQLLRGSGHGKFRTKGRYAAATVRGTVWTTADRCDGTLIHAIKDSVTVNDLVRHKTIILRAGHSYLALAKPKKHK